MIKKILSTRKVVLFILIAVAFQSIFVVYNIAVNDKKTENINTAIQPIRDKDAPEKTIENPIVDGESTNIKKSDIKNIDISKVELDQDAMNVIKNLDKNNGEKNISNFKKMFIEFDMPKEYIKEIAKQMKKGCKVSDAFAIYNFLYDRYGLMSEFGQLLEESTSGKGLDEIFSDYSSSHKEFVPTSFASGYLDELLKDSNITPDDIMNADRLSQKGFGNFEDFIKIKNQGKTWKEINVTFEIINTAEKLPVYSVNTMQIRKYMNENNLTKDKVTEAIILAQKFDKKDEDVLGKMKQGKKKNELSAEFYAEKYN